MSIATPGPAGLADTVNLSILYPSLPWGAAVAAAREAGFRRIESWWPFAGPTPTDGEVAGLVDALEAADVELVALNLYGGDLAGGERGVLPADPDDAAAVAEWERGLREHLRVVDVIAAATGVRLFNTLLGRGAADPTHTALRKRLLTTAAEVVGARGGRLLIEPLSGFVDYPVATVDDARPWLALLGARGGLLADLYHLAISGVDVEDLVRDHGADIVHLQIADAPGRGAPGTGNLPLERWVRAARASGYDGAVVLECRPG